LLGGLSCPYAQEADEEKVLVERPGVLVYGGDSIGWALHTGLIFPSQVPHLHKSRDVPVTVIIKERREEEP